MIFRFSLEQKKKNEIQIEAIHSIYRLYENFCTHINMYGRNQMMEFYCGTVNKSLLIATSLRVFDLCGIDGVANKNTAEQQTLILTWRMSRYL